MLSSAGDYLHVFIMLSVIGGLLVLAGMATLLWVIPFFAERFQKSEARTEFYSARAAYWSVVAGLGVLIVLALSAVALMISIYRK